MALVTLRGVTVGYGGPALLDQVELRIEAAERVCLLGRNGTGKSTLLKVLSGELHPDAGEVAYRQGLRVARLTQEVPDSLEGTVFDVVAGGAGDAGALLSEFERLGARVAEEAAGLGELERVQHALEAADGWALRQRVEEVTSRLGLSPQVPFSSLSGGLKRRVLLARALAGDPDLLLLDEPTNHLDIDAIAWLEEFLVGLKASLLFVTHDRRFLQRLATRIVELDRGRLTSWPGDYANYLRRREERLAAEAAGQDRFDKRLAEEEAWIRQGVKARGTRNQGRLRRLRQMRAERASRRSGPGTARMQLNQAEDSGKVVIEAESVAFGYAEAPVVRDLSVTLLRGDRVGIIGPNGAGKTTLLRLLLGELAPQQGTVRHGTRLEIAYFDQHRVQLNETKSVVENVGEGSDQVVINGAPRHIMSYLNDFLFTSERARTPVAALSGGERNRLLLARLFARPSNVLVLDEPTNDLDMETLELLEELLSDYGGTVLLVSHDRSFLDNVVTSTLVFEGGGRVGEYVGGYEDWLRQRVSKPAGRTRPASPAPRTAARRSSRKLGYREQRELEALPAQIEALEGEQSRLQESMVDPGFYRQSGEAIAEAKARLEAVEAQVRQAYERWESLEDASTEASS